jgi:hypothetical protein
VPTPVRGGFLGLSGRSSDFLARPAAFPSNRVIDSGTKCRAVLSESVGYTLFGWIDGSRIQTKPQQFENTYGLSSPRRRWYGRIFFAHTPRGNDRSRTFTGSSILAEPFQSEVTAAGPSPTCTGFPFKAMASLPLPISASGGSHGYLKVTADKNSKNRIAGFPRFEATRRSCLPWEGG